MHASIYIVFFVVAGLTAAVLLVSLSIIVVSPITRGAMFHPSARVRVKTALDNLPMEAGQYMIDLGCGDGRVIRQAARRYGVRCRGYEINPLMFSIAWLLSLGRRGVTVRCSNFWKVDMGEADVLFCYLFPDIMPELAKKLEGELRPGTRVVSCNFTLPGWKPVRTVHPSGTMHDDPIYFYEVGRC